MRPLAWLLAIFSHHLNPKTIDIFLRFDIHVRLELGPKSIS